MRRRKAWIAALLGVAVLGALALALIPEDAAAQQAVESTWVKTKMTSGWTGVKLRPMYRVNYDANAEEVELEVLVKKVEVVDILDNATKNALKARYGNYGEARLGREFLDEFWDYIVEEMEAFWSHQELVSGNDRLNVRVNIRTKSDDDPFTTAEKNHAWIVKIKLGITRFATIKKDPRRLVMGFAIGGFLNGFTSGNAYTLSAPAHGFGHMLGVDDYTTSTTAGPWYDGNLMGFDDPYDDESRIQPPIDMFDYDTGEGWGILHMQADDIYLFYEDWLEGSGITGRNWTARSTYTDAAPWGDTWPTESRNR